MADVAVSITQGSGTSIDARSESTNGNYRQVVVLGDPATNAGVAPVDATKGLAVDLTATGQNSTALKVDGSAATQPISAASLPLPSGAATAAKQPALGTAGTASADVISVQGIASGTNLNVAVASIAAGGNNIGDVDVLSIVPGVGATSLGKAEDAAHVDGDTGVMVLAIRDDTLNVRSGTENDYEPLHTDAVGAVWVHATDTVAHDDADAGNGVKIVAKAETALSTVTLVADNDRTDLKAGVDGVLITRPYCNAEDTVSGNASNTDGASTECIAAQAGSIKTCQTLIVLTNTSATNTYVEIKDGTTAKLTVPIPANGGAVVPLTVPLRGTAATAWNFDPGTAATTVYCSMVGFKSLV